MPKRLVALGVILGLYGLSVPLGAYTFPVYRNASGISDLGHLVVPPLLPLAGRDKTELVLWLGTLPIEVFFIVIVGVILFTGRGIRLGFCLYVTYFLHWLFIHATTLPPPDYSVWQFPSGVFTLGRPYANDFWFSGHTANATLIALATAGRRVVVQGLAWSNVVLQVLLVLSTRTHYTIDVIGALFVAYAIHTASLALVKVLAPDLDAKDLSAGK